GRDAEALIGERVAADVVEPVRADLGSCPELRLVRLRAMCFPTTLLAAVEARHVDEVAVRRDELPQRRVLAAAALRVIPFVLGRVVLRDVRLGHLGGSHREEVLLHRFGSLDFMSASSACAFLSVASASISMLFVCGASTLPSSAAVPFDAASVMCALFFRSA